MNEQLCISKSEWRYEQVGLNMVNVRLELKVDNFHFAIQSREFIKGQWLEKQAWRVAK